MSYNARAPRRMPRTASLTNLLRRHCCQRSRRCQRGVDARSVGDCCEQLFFSTVESMTPPLVRSPPPIDSRSSPIGILSVSSLLKILMSSTTFATVKISFFAENKRHNLRWNFILRIIHRGCVTSLTLQAELLRVRLPLLRSFFV